MRQRGLLWQTVLLGVIGMLTLGGGCFGSGGAGGAAGDTDGTDSAGGSGTTSTARASDARRQYPLDSLATATITIRGQVLRVWLAQEFDATRPGVVTEGLMHVPAEEIADDQGMLFVFSDEALRGFWMHNTIAPLDIAYTRADGTIVKIWQMPVLTWQTFPSIEPAMFALEVKQGTFKRLGVVEGDRMVISDAVFKVAP